MKQISFIFTLCIIVLMASAQNTKFGKPSQQDWDMQAWGEAPDAEAVILCKMLEISYNLQGAFSQYDSSNPDLSADNVSTAGVNNAVSSKLTTLTYKVKMRIKILKDSGKGWGNIDIVYYDDEQDFNSRDELNDLSVTLFKNENGKIKKTKYGKQSYSDERLTDKYLVRHIRLSDVEAGNIIEYQYELHSSRPFFLYDWYVQDDIPTMYTSCVMNIPYYINFNMEVPTIANVKSDVKASSILIQQQLSDLQAPKNCKSNLYTITSRDLVPWRQMAIKDQKIADLVNGPFNVHAVIKNKIATAPAPMPEGKRHIMLNP